MKPELAKKNVFDALEQVHKDLAIVKSLLDETVGTLTQELIMAVTEQEQWHANYLVENELRLTAEALLAQLQGGVSQEPTS